MERRRKLKVQKGLRQRFKEHPERKTRQVDRGVIVRNLVRAKRRERDCRNTAEIFGGGAGGNREKRRVKKRSSGMDDERKETKTEDQKNKTQTGRTRIMREEDDVERSAGRDREKSSEHAGCKGVRDR